MKLRSILVPGIVLTAFGGGIAWLVLTEPPALPKLSANKENAPSGFREPSPPSTSHESEQENTRNPAAAPLPDNIRDVSPDGVSAPRVTRYLKRIEPSKRYLELKNPPIEPIPDGPLEFVRVQVLDAGHLKSGPLTVKLAYIDPLPLDSTCASAPGGTWPCGTRARTFLRGLVRQLKVSCEKIKEIGPQEILATCSRGSIDLGSRLVRYGWADPTADAPPSVKDLAQTAREKKLGKWQDEWSAEGGGLPDWAETTNSALPDLEALVPEIVDWSSRSDPGSDDDPSSPDIHSDAVTQQ